jgi:hypothetical protein
MLPPSAELSSALASFCSMLAATPNVVVHVSGTGWPTLALALTGIVLSLGALGWQWYSFVFIAGSRVTVELRQGLKGLDAVLTMPEDAADWHIDYARDQGYTDPVYAIKVNNTGRGSTSITAVDLAFSDGGALGLTQHDPPLAFRLKGEDEQTWYIDAQPAVAYAASAAAAWPDRAKNMTVRGRVTLGNKKVVTSKSVLPLA